MPLKASKIKTGVLKYFIFTQTLNFFCSHLCNPKKTPLFQKKREDKNRKWGKTWWEFRNKEVIRDPPINTHRPGILHHKQPNLTYMQHHSSSSSLPFRSLNKIAVCCPPEETQSTSCLLGSRFFPLTCVGTRASSSLPLPSCKLLPRPQE